MTAKKTHRISKHGLDFIKEWETFVPYVYDDKVPMKGGKYPEWKGGTPRGVLTIGYGHTDAAAHPLKIKKGLRVTEKEALNILDTDLDECEAHINKVVTVPLTQGQYDALVSLSFNLGYLTKSARTLLNRLNSKDYKGARGAFDLYVRSGGEVMRGLQRRRDGEQVLWDERYEDIEDVLPDNDKDIQHTAEVDAVNPKNMITSKEGNTILAAGAVDGLKTASDVSDSVANVNKNVTEAGFMDHLIALAQNPKVLAGLAILVACAAVWYWRRKRKQVEAPVNV